MNIGATSRGPQTRPVFPFYKRKLRGRDAPPISCSREAEEGMVVRTQTPRLREIRKTNLELIFSDHDA